jgi:hypothetical protein
VRKWGPRASVPPRGSASVRPSRTGRTSYAMAPPIQSVFVVLVVLAKAVGVAAGAALVFVGAAFVRLTRAVRAAALIADPLYQSVADGIYYTGIGTHCAPLCMSLR